MSNKYSQRTKLLADTLHGDWSTGPAGDFARHAALTARHHRRRRQTALLTGAVAAFAVALVLVRRSPEPSPALRPPAPGTPSAPAYEIISDDVLLAEIHDRPVLAIPRDDGTKQIVVLATATKG